MLLNLLAALSLASIGAVAGISSNSRDVIGRKDAYVYGVNASGAPKYCNSHSDVDDNVFFDGSLNFIHQTLPATMSPTGASYDDSDSVFDLKLMVSFDADGLTGSDNWYSSYSYYIDGHSCVAVSGSFPSYSGCYMLQLSLKSADNTWISEFEPISRLTILKANYSYADFEASHQIVSGIASGLTSVQHYATSLVSGFDALALDNGALTNSMAFAFTLLGIGTAVGICKLTFNWITGRHGM